MDIFQIAWNAQMKNKTLIAIIPAPKLLEDKAEKKYRRIEKTHLLKRISDSEKKLQSLKASVQTKHHQLNFAKRRSICLGFPRRSFGECSKQMYYRNQLIRSISHAKCSFSNPMAILQTAENAEFKKSLEKGMSYLRDRIHCKSISL